MMPILTDRAPYPTYVARARMDTLIERAAKQLDKLESSYKYTYGLEKEEELQKLSTDMQNKDNILPSEQKRDDRQSSC